MTAGLPIEEVLPQLLRSLDEHNTALLQAPPGAGKTTRVPLALLNQPWLRERRVLMLEPRRLAARSAARYMAGQLGEAVGQTVGYRTRLDTRVSKHTRIEVVTEGILTRLIQQDPALESYGAVIFDEFHERSLQADLGLALVRESQSVLREELRLLVMSATLDSGPIAALLEQPPVITSAGRAHPVAVHYRPARAARGRQVPVTERVADVIHEALAGQQGSLLIFLPGVGEIRRVERLLRGHLPKDVRLAPLYGALTPEAQDAAMLPAAEGCRKVVLATAIAETSLTIEGVQVVVDSGEQRQARFDPNSGMTRLVTVPVSQAAAEQRKGRAGRTGPGVCYRLWSEQEQASLSAHDTAEIRTADLAPLVLELARWGARDPAQLAWLDPPPAPHWQQAVALLQKLALLDDEGGLTALGAEARELGTHPRLAVMILQGRRLGLAGLAASLAALLEDRDLLGRDYGCDLHQRVRVLAGEIPVPRSGQGQLQRLQKAVRRLLPDRTGPLETDVRATDVGRLLAFAYPDRIARRRSGKAPRYQLSNGRGAVVREDDALGSEPWLVAADLDGQAREAGIYLAAPLDVAELQADQPDQLETRDEARWDDARGRVVASRQRRFGKLVLESTALPEPSQPAVEAALLDAVRRKGLESLPWTQAARQWQARVNLMRRLSAETREWPDVSDPALLAGLEQWLRPFLAGARRWRDLQQLDLYQALTAQLDYEHQQQLQLQCPTRVPLPTGQSATLDYTADNGPVLAVKLQTLFGCAQTPTVAGGQVAVVCHLLSPAGRPLAVTADLASFWQGAYPEVRKTMRGRYPKHPWPENPLEATPSHGVRRPRSS